MRVRSQEEGGRRDDTKGLIVLAGDSPGLHGRWPGNGYFYPWNTHVQARARFTGHRILIDDYFDETLLAILEGGEGVEFIHEHASIGDRWSKNSHEHNIGSKESLFREKTLWPFCLAPFHSWILWLKKKKKKKKTRSLPSPLLCPTPGKCVETDIYLLSKQGKRVYSDIFVSKTRGGDASLLPDAAKKSISQVFFFFF